MTLYDDSTAHDFDSANSVPPSANRARIPTRARRTSILNHSRNGCNSTTPEQKPAMSTTATEENPVVPTPAAEDKPAPQPLTILRPALETFTTEAEEAVSEDRVIKGTVLKLTDKHVVVDIGAKSEGMLPLAEVLDHEGKPRFKPGDEIDVMRDKGEAEEGYINLSHQKAQRLRAWDDIEAAYNEKKPIKAVVIDRIKGGLTVDIAGARAFLPGSQVDLRPVRNLDGMKGTTIEVAVIKLNKKRGNIVVSRKQLLEEEQNEKKSKTLEHLEEGAVLTGVVKNLTEYGAFVDMGGIDGLLHITDMSWGRLTHPRDLVNVGDQIQVKVLKFDKDKQRVSLGFKQLTPDPWLDAEHRYPVGAHVSGRVISVTDYGAFVELEQGIEGLVHVSEMTWSKRMKHPSKLVNVGDQVECVVLNVNPDRAPHFAGHAPTGVESLGQLARQIPGGHDGGRPRSQPDRLRRLHRDRRRHRRPGPRQQPELDQAREASFGSTEEGRSREGCGSGDRARQAPPVAGREAAAARCLGDVLRSSITSATWCTAKCCAWRRSARSLKSPRASKASATTRKQSTATASRFTWNPALSTTSRSSR